MNDSEPNKYMEALKRYNEEDRAAKLSEDNPYRKYVTDNEEEDGEEGIGRSARPAPYARADRCARF